MDRCYIYCRTFAEVVGSPIPYCYDCIHVYPVCVATDAFARL